MPIVQPITNCFSEVTGYLQADYPYSWKLRCERVCWLERDPKRGYRFCFRTSNPKKPGTWNAVKKSTYTMLAIMGLDEDNHITWESLSRYDVHSTQEFVAKWGHAFNDGQAQDSAAILRVLSKFRAIGPGIVEAHVEQEKNGSDPSKT